MLLLVRRRFSVIKYFQLASVERHATKENTTGVSFIGKYPNAVGSLHSESCDKAHGIASFCMRQSAGYML